MEVNFNPPPQHRQQYFDNIDRFIHRDYLTEEGKWESLCEYSFDIAVNVMKRFKSMNELNNEADFQAQLYFELVNYIENKKIVY